MKGLTMRRSATLACVLILSLVSVNASAVAPPSKTATIVVRGFENQGASATGTFGSDKVNNTVEDLAASIGLPTSTVNPLAPNQVAYTDYYGNTPPSYYTQADLDDLTSVTNAYGGGIPRYALIVAKYAKHVMQRSGAEQVNLLGLSMGGLVSRWIVEKDVEGLVSSGKVARWIVIEGVVAGNWICSEGGQSLRDFVEDTFDLNPIDLQHMDYDWVTANIHNPRDESSNPLLSNFPIHFWTPADDDLNGKALTLASQKANDGVQLLRDTYLRDLAPAARYLGLKPTRSFIHATHESSKQNLGIRAGVAANLFGRRRVTVTLHQVYVNNDKESSSQEPAEIVFGVEVKSPRAQTLYGITAPVNDRRFMDNSMPVAPLPEDTTVTVGLVFFDDMILPGEDRLRIKTDVREVDYDIVYGINENIFNPEDTLDNIDMEVSTLAPADYHVRTDDWRGILRVEVTDYPPFDPPARVDDWALH
jgi:pimeloyl-ACP methyl ester carboxylesterase